MFRARTAVALLVPLSIVGCAQVLGLDDFTDAPRASGGGGGTTTSSTGSTSSTTSSGGAGPGSGGAAASTGEGGAGGSGCKIDADCPQGPNGSPKCTNGQCGFTCMDGFGDCDASPGCETDLSKDDENCGACGTQCATHCVASSCDDPVAVAAGGDHTCAIRQSGSLWCWGLNKSGELGIGSTAQQLVPVQVPLAMPVTQVSANSLFFPALAMTCAVLGDHTLKCWGIGDLGDGMTTSSSSPFTVPLPNVEQVSVGGQHICAITTAQDLWCWGANTYGEVGNGTTTEVKAPVKVASGIAAVAAGNGFTCAATTNGDLKCWGHNDKGQLGLGNTQDQHAPQDIFAIASVKQLALGAEHACAVGDVGLWCWGDNAYGQLGIGTLDPKSKPTAVSLASAQQVAAGSYHTMGIASGMLSAWGRNSSGQLGDGTAVDSSSPTSISAAISVSLGFSHSCAIDASHVLRCWGDNSSGQLGDGTTTSHSSPAPVQFP